MKRHLLIKGIVFMLLFSSIVPISIGNDINASDVKKQSYDKGNTLYVGGNGPNNYTKIQEALDIANPGDTVFVYNGTYYENIDFKKDYINLIGEDIKKTIINGVVTDHVVEITEKSYITLRNFTIKGGNCGIYLSGNHCQIIGNIITFNRFGISLEKFVEGVNNIGENSFKFNMHAIRHLNQDNYNFFRNNFIGNILNHFFIRLSLNRIFNCIFENNYWGKPMMIKFIGIWYSPLSFYPYYPIEIIADWNPVNEPYDI